VFVDSKETHVDSLGGQEVAHEHAVGIGPDTRDDRRCEPESRKPGRNVAGEAPDEPRVGSHLAQRRTELVRVEVDPDPPEHCDVDHAAIFLRNDNRRSVKAPNERWTFLCTFSISVGLLFVISSFGTLANVRSLLYPALRH